MLNLLGQIKKFSKGNSKCFSTEISKTKSEENQIFSIFGVSLSHTVVCGFFLATLPNGFNSKRGNQIRQSKKYSLHFWRLIQVPISSSNFNGHDRIFSHWHKNMNFSLEPVTCFREKRSQDTIKHQLKLANWFCREDSNLVSPRFRFDLIFSRKKLHAPSSNSSGPGTQIISHRFPQRRPSFLFFELILFKIFGDKNSLNQCVMLLFSCWPWRIWEVVCSFFSQKENKFCGSHLKFF